MMPCQRAREALPLLLYGDLAGPEAEAVQAHLRTCADCRQEFAALGSVRQALAAPASAVAPVDLGLLYRQAAEQQARQARRWRRASGVLAAAAAVLVIGLGVRVEVRFEAQQCVVRWGAPPEVVAPTPAPLPSVAPPMTPEDLQPLRNVLLALAADLQERDRQQQQTALLWQYQIEALQRQNQQRWLATERDVSALYAAQFGPRAKGD